MPSGPFAATAALLSLALILPGCGDKGTATAGGGEESTNVTRTKASAPAASKRCGVQLGDFLDSSESLGNTLAVGLDYEQYLGSVNRVRAGYADIPAKRLGLVCLGRVATPAEQSLNLYIDAANLWGNCLASTSCAADSIEARLQREWEGAAELISQARNGLRG
jgi:hypothetical protein